MIDWLDDGAQKQKETIYRVRHELTQRLQKGPSTLPAQKN